MVSGRRRFLSTVIGAVAATRALEAARQGGFEAFALPGPSCTDATTLTPEVPADRTFKPGSPRRTSLIEPGLPGTRLQVRGTVAGITCGRITGAVIDFWQPDSQGRYDAVGFRLRGQQLTGPMGEFELLTIVPGAPPGRAPHLGVRIQPPGRPVFWTELFLSGDARNAGDARFRDTLALHLSAEDAPRRATFNFVLDA
jgi:protocatechuate 3,4-dioxygenase beta subunit